MSDKDKGDLLTWGIIGGLGVTLFVLNPVAATVTAFKLGVTLAWGDKGKK